MRASPTGLLKDAHVPCDFTLGREAFRDMGLYFDFEHWPTCLLLHDHLR